MPVLSVGNTVYIRPVAKVMISIPETLLERIDRLASERGETRSGFLQVLAERELGSQEDGDRKEIRRLLDLATKPMGGDAARIIREDRDSH
jgi:metal-responsive CopG/Arc/MetJ family transcriptional regulator